MKRKTVIDDLKSFYGDGLLARAYRQDGYALVNFYRTNFLFTDRDPYMILWMTAIATDDGVVQQSRRRVKWT